MGKLWMPEDRDQYIIDTLKEIIKDIKRGKYIVNSIEYEGEPIRLNGVDKDPMEGEKSKIILNCIEYPKVKVKKSKKKKVLEEST